MAAIETKHVQGRRVLHFASIDDAVRDARAIAAAEADGKLRALGNWTPGQSFGHIAGWINYAFDGYPADVGNPPWFVRLVMKFMKKRMLRGMPAGVRIPRVPGGTRSIDPMATDEGLTLLTRAWQRLGSGAPTRPSPLFGPMTHEEWIALNLRHAELHQSFFLIE